MLGQILLFRRVPDGCVAGAPENLPAGPGESVRHVRERRVHNQMQQVQKSDILLQSMSDCRLEVAQSIVPKMGIGVKKMFKFEGSHFSAEVATVWELAGLPPHVKHVHVKFLDNAMRPPAIKENLPIASVIPSKIRTFNFESLRIDDFAKESVWHLDFKCFLRGCFQKLRVLHLGRCSLSIADSIRVYHWRQLRELRVDSFVVVAHVTFLGLFPENFPRLDRIYICCSSCHNISNTTDPVFKRVFKHTETQKQLATTTFLTMRYFLPAELAFVIAEEAAFGPPLVFLASNKKLKNI